jgi:hypothetical protein
VRVARVGWGAENTIYRETFRLTWYDWSVGHDWFPVMHVGLLPLWRAEAEYLARHDFMAGRRRFLGAGRTGFDLTGISGAREDESPWRCSLAFVAIRRSLDGLSVLKDGSYEIVCDSETQGARRFIAEVTNVGCVITPDYPRYNVAMLRRIVSDIDHADADRAR